MKLLAPFALAALAMTVIACTDTTRVSGSWRDDPSVPGACRPFFFDTDAHIQIFDSQHIVASESFDCDERGFTLEIPTDVTHVRVTATDPEGSHWDKEFDISDGYLDVGTITFFTDPQPD